jgi:putative ABC transport system permease protein
MEYGAILSYLRRNKTGAVLIAIQVAITLAIICNALFLVEQQATRMLRPSGVDEANIVSFNATWLGNVNDLKSRLQGDLAALRSIPGVVDSFATIGLPLLGTGLDLPVTATATPPTFLDHAAVYPVDEHALNVLGVRLASGRWFNAEEILDSPPDPEPLNAAPVVVVTKSLAAKLFPSGSAVGEHVFVDGKTATVIGVVERMQMPWVYGLDSVVENSVLVPYLVLRNDPLYVLRAKPGTSGSVLKTAQARLLQIDGHRVIDNAATFAETRGKLYKPFTAMIRILSLIVVILLLIGGLGIVSVTSYWVVQRRRHIGIRRALGARRSDILQYFHLENALIVGVGVLLGATLTVVMNLWLVTAFEMTRLPLPIVGGCAMLFLILGQISVIWPALKASHVSPAEAIRGG